MRISSRSRAVREGNRHGLYSPRNVAAHEAATGRGLDARVVPVRWRHVFERAFKRARRYARLHPRTVGA
jgi:hypothetical protein